MRENIFIKIVRFFNPFRQADTDEKQDNDHSLYREQTNETIEVKVDDEKPDFLKDKGKEESSQNKEVQTEEKKQLPADNAGKIITQDEAKPNNGETSTFEEEKKPEEPVANSLLDNKPLVKMFEECAEMIKNLERISPAFESDDSKDLINTVREQLVQAMILSGGKTIDNETAFNTLRHKCLKGIRANDGDKIINTLEPGVVLEERVFVKALVEIANN